MLMWRSVYVTETVITHSLRRTRLALAPFLSVNVICEIFNNVGPVRPAAVVAVAVAGRMMTCKFSCM